MQGKTQEKSALRGEIQGPAVQALAGFAAERIARRPPREQTKIYSALGQTLEARRARAAARNIAKALSRAAALQLELSVALEQRRRTRKRKAR